MVVYDKKKKVIDTSNSYEHCKNIEFEPLVHEKFLGVEYRLARKDETNGNRLTGLYALQQKTILTTRA